MSFQEQHLVELTNEDLVRYFTGTFVKVLTPESDVFQYESLAEINGHGRSAEFSFENRKRTSYFSFPLKSLRFDLTFPKAGYYELKDTAVYYNQLPARQSQKGLNYHSHQISDFIKGSLPYFPRDIQYMYRGVTDIWNANTLNQLFLSSEEIPVAKKIDSVFKNKVISRPLSQNFLISLGLTSLTPQLWFKGLSIGVFSAPDQIKIDNELFFQEAIDFFPSHNVEVTMNSSQMEHHDK